MLDVKDFVWAIEEYTYPQPLELSNPLHKKHIEDVAYTLATAHFREVTRLDVEPTLFWDLSDLQNDLIAEGLSPKVAYYIQAVVDAARQDFYIHLNGDAR